MANYFANKKYFGKKNIINKLHFPFKIAHGRIRRVIRLH